MEVDAYKEVDFFTYCRKCRYSTTFEDEEPCEECLKHPVNLYSRKPVKFESADGKE